MEYKNIDEEDDKGDGSDKADAAGPTAGADKDKAEEVAAPGDGEESVDELPEVKTRWPFHP